MKLLISLFISLSFLILSHISYAEETLKNSSNVETPTSVTKADIEPYSETDSDTESEEKSSPWIATPLISSDPKLGTNIGALVGFLHHFDEKSPVSMIGLAGIYSNTDSYGGSLFGNLYFDEDNQRLLTFVGLGNIKNEYTYE